MRMPPPFFEDIPALVDEDADGKCDYCELSKKPCAEHNKASVYNNKCGDCNYKVTPIPCDAHKSAFDKECADCRYVIPCCSGDHIDKNSDSVCDRCGLPSEECETHTSVYPVDSGYRCSDCKFVIKRRPCNDHAPNFVDGCDSCKYVTSRDGVHGDENHGDDLCDICGAEYGASDEFFGAFEIFYDQMFEKEAYKDVLSGLLVTIRISIIGLVIGIVIGTLIAIVKVMPKGSIPVRILNVICDIYVGFFRGTPMYVQLLIGFFVLLPMTPLIVEESVAATAIFGLNSGAYIAEIMRSGIQSVDVGQLEAGRAVGLPYSTAMMKIVIPQSIKNILPTLGNEFIVLIKETSIVSFIGAVDITKAFTAIGDATYSYVIPYLALAALYLVMVVIITIGIRAMERRFKRSERNT